MKAAEDPRPLCFVLMPFGDKHDPVGGTVEFDRVYQEVIRPAVEAAGLRAVRADEEQVGGIIHKPMFERLVLCEYAVADLTLANANVYYELGVRHAVRPWSTVLVFADGFRLPFDLGPLRGVPYALDGDGRPRRAGVDARALTAALHAARHQSTDSPVFQLLEGLPVPDVSRLKTDVFRDRVDVTNRHHRRVALARSQGPEALTQVWRGFGDLRQVESGVLVDVLLSLRALSAHEQMVELVEALPDVLAASTLVREQYAFALNRCGRGQEAEQVLLRLVEDKGPSSETYGLLGRVYKDRWDAAVQRGEVLLARGLLDKAITAYLRGFESDWRDHYPGINALQLMGLREPPDPRAPDLLPVVRYSVQRRLASGSADYWDHATLLELAVMAGDPDEATAAVARALAAVREPWEPASTASTLRRLRQARDKHGQSPTWALDVERALERAAGTRAGPADAP